MVSKMNGLWRVRLTADPDFNSFNADPDFNGFNADPDFKSS